MHPRSPEREPGDPVFSLVLPTYNPGPALERTWRQIIDFLSRSGDSWEVLFACDGCTDGSPARLRALARTLPDRVRILEHSPNRGKGFTVRRAFAAARGQYRIFTDFDLAYGFDDVLRLADTLRAGADVGIASRLHPHSRVQLPTALQGYAYRRHLQSLVFSALVRWILPVKQRDTQAGLKGLSARAAALLLPRLCSVGFEFDCELLTACVALGLTVVEVPVCVRYENTLSTTNLGSVAGMVRQLWSIRRAWQSGQMHPDSISRRTARLTKEETKAA
jgi:hypothetical protein